MTKRYRKVILTILIFLGSFSFAMGQRQTGSIRGFVFDEEGGPLPGATISIMSPSLMGTQSFISSANGAFRFPACPPGEYIVRVELDGFQTLDRPDVIVHVGLTVDITLVMTQESLAEEVVVTAPSPMIDKKSSKLSTTITTEIIKNAPMPRDIFDMLLSAPGTVKEDIGGRGDYRRMASVHGGTLQQNTYAIDGVSLTDPHVGYIAKDVVFDAIEEIEIVSGAHGAETGLTSGGFINVVSKSGGNTFSGSLNAQYTSEALQSSTVPSNTLEGLNLATPTFDKYYVDFGLNLGGPILKDRVWFFLSPRMIKFTRGNAFIPFTDPTGTFHDLYDNKISDYSLFSKVSAQITKNIKFMLMWQYNDLNEDPAIITTGWMKPYEANITTNDYAHAFSSVFTVILNQNTFLEIRGGYLRKIRDLQTNSWREGREAPMSWDRYTGRMWGAYWADEFYIRQSHNINVQLTRYQDDFLGGNHELKLGAEYGGWNVLLEYPRKADPFWHWYYNGEPWYFHDTMPYTGYLVAWANGPKGTTESKGKQWRASFYIQDNVSIGEKLSLNIGLRYDYINLSRPEEIKKGWVDRWYDGLANLLYPELFTTTDIVAPAINGLFTSGLLQPRLGFNYDLLGDGTTILKGSFSRYADYITNIMFSGTSPFSGQAAEFLWFDNDRDGYYDLPDIDTYAPLWLPPVITDPEELTEYLDPNLNSPYVDEFTLGIHREILQDFSAGVNFIYKEHKNLFEALDTANPIDGPMWVPYTVTDPGDDGEFGTGDEQDLTVYAMDNSAEYSSWYTTNIEELKRKYWGVELVLFKRMTTWWQFSGSITYSKTYGNISSNLHDVEGGLGIFMNPNNLINYWGRQTWDRPLIIKLMGTMRLPYGINFSGYFRYSDGAPAHRTLTVYFPSSVGGVVPRYLSETVNAEPPGSKRGPSYSLLDLRLEKEFSLQFGRIGLFMDLFNVLGNNVIITEQDNGGYLFNDGSFARYPQYGELRQIIGTRQVRFTLRFNF